MKVSILVLMDSSLQFLQAGTLFLILNVSILVLMDSSLQFDIGQGNGEQLLRVSILVLMDSSLQSTLITQPHMDDSCFNPCFNGFFSSIRNSPYLYFDQRNVSILVLMDSSLQSCHPKDEHQANPSFNPCFNGFFSSIESSIPT